MMQGNNGKLARVSRRQVVLALGGAGLPSARPAATPAAADRFVDSVGLNVHLGSPPYDQQFDTVIELAAALGVRHFRDELRPANDLARWRALHARAGIRSHLLISPATNTVPELLDYLEALGAERVSAVEGQNEGDSPWFGAQEAARGGWAEAVVAYQRDVFTALRTRYPGPSLPVLSPTVLDYAPADMHRIASAAPYCDAVALHAYAQGGQEPETEEAYAGLAWYLREFRDPFKPGAPAMLTEAGYHAGSDGLSETARAKYLPRLLLHAWSAGIVRTFLYEFMDEGAGQPDPEQNYGLVSSAGEPKPAFGALCRLLGALSDPGPGFAPEPLAIDPQGAACGLRIVPFAKRSGEVVLALWRPRALLGPGHAAGPRGAIRPAPTADVAAVRNRGSADAGARTGLDGAARARRRARRLRGRHRDPGAAHALIVAAEFSFRASPFATYACERESYDICAFNETDSRPAMDVYGHQPRIAIVHDWLYVFGGAERVLAAMLRAFPGADLYTLFDVMSPADRDRVGFRSARTSFLQRMPAIRTRHRAYLPLMPLAVEQFDLSGYDLVISSSHAVAKGVLTGPDQLHLAYVHSPMRYAWDLQHRYLAESGLTRGVRGALARTLLHRMRMWDSRTAHGVDAYAANSHFIARRIRKAYGREAEVIPPPVSIPSFASSAAKGGYFLTVSRMVQYKNVRALVEAFAAMPDQRLVVAGSGPELPRLHRTAGPNVEFRGFVPEAELGALMRGADAFVYAAEEDFGIVLAEAQAHGAPVIALGRGGAREIVATDGPRPTGLFFDDPEPSAIAAAVRAFLARREPFRPADCHANALRFSEARFDAAFRSFVGTHWARHCERLRAGLPAPLAAAA